jgi:molybdopterin-containing oxidoreductase family membrane subunit
MSEGRLRTASLQTSPPVVAPDYSPDTVTEAIASVVLTRRARVGWWIAFGISVGLVLLLFYAVTAVFFVGVGEFGINVPVAWGFAITNFVWWIGIGHAGTLISAILLLLHQEWRTSINRFAEAMTLFAVACAGLFPILHLGRPWVFYWLFPYPDTMRLWPQFRSPLVWDVFAVSTYFTVSLLFWYVGLLPDLATLRDRASSRFARIAYGVMALGWRGAARHWRRYETAYLLLAGLATPLVVSVHTVVSFDFSVGIVPGWHSTIFPPYFVAGAIFSGFAMVLTIAVPLRRFYRFEGLITVRHLDNMAKVMLATGLVVAYGYMNEVFLAWYSGNVFERAVMSDRMLGAYGPQFWWLVACNVVAPQFLWSRRIRRSAAWLFALSLVINLGMWLERYVIVVQSLHRDFLPSSWGMFHPTFYDWSALFGTLGLFAALMFVFVRLLPAIAMAEMRQLVSENGRAAA